MDTQLTYLKLIRKRAKLRIYQAAANAGIKRAHYGHIENRVKCPSLPVALKIAKKFRTTVEKLFDIDGMAKVAEVADSKL